MITEHSLKVLNKALRTLKPEGGFKHNGTPESVEVIDGSAPIDQAELLAAIAQAEIDISANAYKEKRAAEYPPLEELADALVKLNSQQEDIHLAGQAQLENYVQACLAVKNKYKKG